MVSSSHNQNYSTVEIASIQQNLKLLATNCKYRIEIGLNTKNGSQKIFFFKGIPIPAFLLPTNPFLNC